MKANDNIDLKCIEVDDVDIAKSKDRWTKDGFAEYSMDCQYLSSAFIKSEEIIFYPNPVGDILHFEHPISQIRLLDASGKVIMWKNDHSDQMSLSHLADGVYFITGLSMEGKHVGGKIVKASR